MDLDEQEYRRKYLKYKLKYKNLKKQQQIGGILSTSDKQLTEYFKKIYENDKHYNVPSYLSYFDPLTNIPLEITPKEIATTPTNLIADLRDAEKIKKYNRDIINTIKNIIETKDLKKIKIILENFIPQIDTLLEYKSKIDILEHIKSDIQLMQYDIKNKKDNIDNVDFEKKMNIYKDYGEYIDIIILEYNITKNIILQYFTILIQKTILGTYKIIDNIKDFEENATSLEKTRVLIEIRPVENYMDTIKKKLQTVTEENAHQVVYLQQIDEIIEAIKIINKNIKR